MLTLNDLMVKGMNEVIKECNVVSLKPCTNDDGEIVKIIVEYVPKETTTVKPTQPTSKVYR